MDFIKKSLKVLSYLRISDYNEGNNYNEWVGIAAALKNIGVPYSEFDAWCSGGSNYEPEANQKTWDALNPTESVGQSVGWLIKLAQRNGMDIAEVK